MKLVIIRSSGLIEPPRGVAGESGGWEAIPGAVEAIARLTLAGVRCVLLGDRAQSRDGAFDIDALLHGQQRMLRAIAQRGGRIEALAFCPHDAGQPCVCDSSEQGLLQQIVQRARLSAGEVALITNHAADRDAARALGITVQSMPGARGGSALEQAGPAPADLAAAINLLLCS